MSLLAFIYITGMVIHVLEGEVHPDNKLVLIEAEKWVEKVSESFEQIPI